LSELLSANLLAKLHPATKGIFEFWVDDTVLRASKISVGDELRFKTSGDSILLIYAQPTNVTNFDKMEGGNVMNQVSKLTDRFADAPEKLPQENMQGVEDSEWD